MTSEKNVRNGEFEILYRQNIDLRRQVDQLSTLREIGLAISGTLEMSETLPLIVQVVQGAADVRRVTIFEPVPEDSHLMQPVIAQYGGDLIGPERLEEETVYRQGTPLGEAMESREVILLETQHRNAAWVPLIAKYSALGVMLLEDRRDGQPFSREDARLFQLMGSQIAVAINNAQLYAQAVTDGLTRLYVRRYFDLRLQEEFAKARRYGRPFAMLIFDIDHFKKFNDTHGHQTGDAVLRQFADLLRKNTRSADVCCRYGGEEMTVILPETALDEAAALAEKLCATIRGHVFTGTAGQDLSVTASIGVAAYRPDCDGPDAMVEAADKVLYAAKESGRDRVMVAEAE
jgi:diguanylate cyclase (GGDEF)-like protein